MNGTNSAKIHCPNRNCGKPILSQVALAEGSRFVLRCANCQQLIKIITGFNVIHKRVLLDIREQVIISAEAQQT